MLRDQLLQDIEYLFSGLTEVDIEFTKDCIRQYLCRYHNTSMGEIKARYKIHIYKTDIWNLEVSPCEENL